MCIRDSSTFLSATRDQVSRQSGSICGRARAPMNWARPGEVTPRRRAARPGFRWVQIGPAPAVLRCSPEILGPR
eukprot:6389924-Prymnesium_polylepis.1